MCSGGGIAFEDHMAHACIPDAIQLSGSLARDYDEALSLACIQTEVLGFGAVHDDYSVQA